MVPWLKSKPPLAVRPITWFAVPEVEPICMSCPAVPEAFAAINMVKPGFPETVEGITLERESLVPSKERAVTPPFTW